MLPLSSRTKNAHIFNFPDIGCRRAHLPWTVEESLLPANEFEVTGRIGPTARFYCDRKSDLDIGGEAIVTLTGWLESEIDSKPARQMLGGHLTRPGAAGF